MGDAAPFTVLLHGITRDRTMYIDAYRDLRRENQSVIAIDLVGHGRSDKPPDPECYTPRWQAESVRSVLDAVGVDTASVIGQSWGGQVAMALAANHSSRVNRLVLDSTSCSMSDTYMHTGSLLDRMRSRVHLTVRDSIMAYKAARWTRADHDCKECSCGEYSGLGWVNHIFERMKTRDEVSSFVHAFKSMMNEDVYDAVDVLEAPTLLLHSLDDQVVSLKGPDGIHDALYERHVPVQRRYFSGDTHCLVSKRWNDVRDEVLGFLVPSRKKSYL